MARGEKKVVGVNAYIEEGDGQPEIEILRIDPAVEKDQHARLATLRKKRDAKKAQAELDGIVQRELPMYFADWTGRHTQYESALGKLKFDWDVNHRRPQGKNADFDVRRKLGMLRTLPTVIVALTR